MLESRPSSIESTKSITIYEVSQIVDLNSTLIESKQQPCCNFDFWFWLHRPFYIFQCPNEKNEFECICCNICNCYICKCNKCILPSNVECCCCTILQK